MLLTCTNILELKSKGIYPIETVTLDLLDLDLSKGVVVIDLTKAGKVDVFPKWRVNLPAIWFIREESFTDNNDNDNLTYFKYTC